MSKSGITRRTSCTLTVDCVDGTGAAGCGCDAGGWLPLLSFSFSFDAHPEEKGKLDLLPRSLVLNLTPAFYFVIIIHTIFKFFLWWGKPEKVKTETCVWCICNCIQEHVYIYIYAQASLFYKCHSRTSYYLLSPPHTPPSLLHCYCVCVLGCVCCAQPDPPAGTRLMVGSFPLCSLFKLGKLAGGGIRRAADDTLPRLCNPCCRGTATHKIKTIT